MILLSFDIEEFDLPKEHGVDISFEESMRVSKEGTRIILQTLKEMGAKATFFCTTNFAENAPELIHQIVADGHELASHGCDHFNPKEEDVSRSKPMLEAIGGVTVRGYRQPHGQGFLRGIGPSRLHLRRLSPSNCHPRSIQP